jgi:hypothetical protein
MYGPHNYLVIQSSESGNYWMQIFKQQAKMEWKTEDRILAMTLNKKLKWKCPRERSRYMMEQLVSKTVMQQDKYEGRVAMRGHRQTERLGC